MPKESCRTLTIGARQLVVHDAFEMTWWAVASKSTSLTPITNVASASLQGADTMTEIVTGRRFHAVTRRATR
jgi:hypothetical protein